MKPTGLRSAVQDPSIEHETAPRNRSVTGSFAFAALLAVPFFVAAYPVVAVALVTGGLVLAALSWSIGRRVRRHRGSIRHLTLPGFGTVEYRFTRG